MSATASIGRLDDLGILRFRGPDALSFLQGQLSQDMQRLATTAPGASVLAGLHNPQGRTLALLRLSGTAQDITAVLPAALVSPTAAALRRYVLRAKLSIIEEQTLVPLGIAADEERLATLCAQLGLDDAPGTRLRLGAENRWLVLAPASSTVASDVAAGVADAVQALRREDWRARDIAAGLPQVFLPTSGAFVGQMLNLDCVDAISFTKGCYTGQEVIARAHYRGKVKRRMQRFLSRAAVTLAPGDAGALPDGRTFRVVEAVVHADGRCEFLAVTALHAAAAAAAAAEGEDAPPGATIDCASLPLPYALPE